MKTFNLFLSLLFICLLSNAQNDWTKIKQQPTKGALASQMAKDGDIVLLGTQSGIFRSTDNGETWNKVNDEITYPLADEGGTLKFSGDTALAVHSAERLYSFDGGQNWNTISAPDSLKHDYHFTHQQFVEDQIFYIAYRSQSDGFLFYTNDFGQTWHIDTTYHTTDINHINLNNQWLFRYHAPTDQLRFTKDGKNFHQLPTPAVNLAFDVKLKGDTSDLYLGTPQAILKYNSSSETWDPITSNVPGGGTNNLVAAKEDTVVMVRYGSSNSNLSGFISTNSGGSWTEIDLTEFGYPALSTVAFENGDIWAPTAKGLYKSEDLGASWSNESGELYSRLFAPQSLNGNVVGSNLSNHYKYDPDNQNFEGFSLPSSLPTYVFSSIEHTPKVLYHSSQQPFGEPKQKIFFSKDVTNGWDEASLPRQANTPLFLHNNFLVTSDRDGGFYFSNDHGQSWDSLEMPVKIFSIDALSSYEDGMVLAVLKQQENSGPEPAIYYSEDDGESWNSIAPDPSQQLSIPSMSYMVTFNDELLAFPRSQNNLVDSIFRYSNGEWAVHTIDDVTIHSFIGQVRKKNGSIYLLNDSALFVSEDRGRNWEVERVLPEPGKAQAYSIAFSGDHLMLGTNEGFYQTVGYSASVEDQGKTKKQSFEVFPNPVSGNQVHLKYATSTPANPKTMSGTIYNNQGQPIKQFEWKTGAKEKQKALELPEGLKSGIYHIRIQAGDKGHSNSFIKQ